MVAFRYAARSDIGLRRKNNQDSAYAGINLLVVADGMGGYAGGDVASSLVISELAALDNDAPGADALQELERAIHTAADAIRERVGDEPDLANMGTTVTAILRHGRRLALAHIGDSRAYLLRDGELTQITTDHTFVQRLVDEGRITPDEAAHHPQRNIVTRVIGDVDAPEDVDTSVREAVPGDRWLLCSDGLAGPVSAPTIAETLTRVSDPAECADKLIDLALRAGGADNITCIVADVVRETETRTATTPQVVGAAAITRDAPSRAANSAAGKAAALTPAPTATEELEYTDVDEQPDRRGRTVRSVIGALIVIGLIAAGVYGAWVWSQRQVFVGTVDGKVAIYSGLSDDIGPVKMSTVHTTYEELPVDSLSPVNQRRVAAGIGADDLADARRIVINLFQDSSVCTPTVIVANPVPTPTPSPTPTGPPAAETPAVTPTAPSGTSTPQETVTLPVPQECTQ